MLFFLGEKKRQRIGTDLVKYCRGSLLLRFSASVFSTKGSFGKRWFWETVGSQPLPKQGILSLQSTQWNIRERPPGLIQHVLTVLVFWSWVLLLPWLPPLSRSLRLFPWASILLHGPLDSCLDLLPTAPLPPVQKTGRTAHAFTAQGGTLRF